MTHSLTKRAALPCLAMAALLATGCASVAASNTGSASCNALLKAAGKCQ